MFRSSPQNTSYWCCRILILFFQLFHSLSEVHPHITRWRGANHESQKRKRSKAWLEAEPITTESWPETGVSQQIGHGVSIVPAEFLLVVGAQPRRERSEILEQPRSDVDGVGGMPSLSHVRDAVRGRSQVPQVQEHRFAGFPPWHQQPHRKEELE